MGECGDGQGFDVIGQGEVATVDGSQSAGGAKEGERAARAGAQVDVGVLARGRGQSNDVFLNLIIDVDGLHSFGCRRKFLARHDLRDVLDGVMISLRVEDGHLVAFLWVAEVNAHDEAVDLGFRERKGAFVFDRVLGGENQEGPVQGIGGAVHGHLAFFHRFEQRRLGLRCGAIDLVGEGDLGKDGAGTELKFLSLLIVDRDAGDIAGQHVGRELDAAEAAANGAGDGPG